MDTSQAGEPVIGDAFGLALLDYLEHGSDGWDHFVERDDGLLEFIDPGVFFESESDWSATEAVVLERAGYRVLDIGAGAGRHALPLQQAAHDVVALDISPGAIEVCGRRDVRRTFTGTVFDLADTGGGPFDTFLLCGNNLGLLESPAHAGRFLGALDQLAAPGAEIIGTCVDPLATINPLHLEYHELNSGRGRLPGQLRLWTRWANVASPWFDYLFLPVQELEALAKESGWRLVEQQPGPRPYLAVLQRK